MATLFARFNSSAYIPASTNNCWNDTTGANPLLWLSSAETKSTENEFARLETNSATAGAWPGMYFAKSRGTLLTKTTAADTDVLGFIGFKGYDGDEYEISAGIKVIIEGAVSNNVVPARMEFQTSATDSAGRTTRMSITNDGKIIIASIPTSSAGLAAGTLWSDAGTIKIV
jgi:hypothetical protein